MNRIIIAMHLAYLFHLCYNCFMKNFDLQYICTAIGNLSGIPVRLYEEDKLIFCHSLVNLPKDPILVITTYHNLVDNSLSNTL